MELMQKKVTEICAVCINDCERKRETTVWVGGGGATVLYVKAMMTGVMLIVEGS